MIQVKRVSNPTLLKQFVTFPFKLYKNSKYWVPPLIAEEMRIFNEKTNPVFKNAEAHLFLAYKNDVIVGRIAAIINWIEVKDQEKPKIRFGWFDTIDDLEVSTALFQKVAEVGKNAELTFIEGPVGFSNMDKAGMLVDGFDRVNNMTTIYNYAYYPQHMKALGFTTGLSWVEYEISVPTGVPEKVKKFSNLVLKRYHLKLLHFKSSKELIHRADAMFDLMNRSFKDLDSFVPIQPYQVELYKKKYLKFIHPDFITLIADKNDNMVAFSITMPSFANAMQKAKGKLFPFGFLHLLRAKNRNDKANLFLIGVDPDYQSKGLTAVIFQKTIENFIKRNIKTVETNPELEDNTAVQALWKNYDPQLIKKWQTFKREI